MSGLRRIQERDIDQITSETVWCAPRAAITIRSLLIAAMSCLAGAVFSQPLPLDRPGDVLPDLPEYEQTPAQGASPLPKIKLPEGETSESLAAGRQVFVRAYALSGNTVIDDETLLELTRPYENRNVTFAELAALRDAITKTYIDAGYATSGAVIPRQALDAGVLRIEIQEGVLNHVESNTDGRLRAKYVRDRLTRNNDEIVNIGTLERRLQILQNQDERIQQITASLRPSEQRGSSVLDVTVREAKPWSIRTEFSNHESPSVGEFRGLIEASHNNITGYGDRLALSYRLSEGLRSIKGSYKVPLNRYDVSLELYAQDTRSEVVEEPFSELDVQNESQTAGVALSVPVHRTAASLVTLSLAGEYRRGESSLLGSPFSFSAGAEDGISDIAVLRFSQSLTLRKPRHALSVLSTFSAGLNALGSTRHAGEIPDSQFGAWLAQAQFARRLQTWNAQFTARGALQLSTAPLLGLEQFALGGNASVRGYRENALVRDNGAVASFGITVPVIMRRVEVPALQVGPFVDAGYSWSHTGTTGKTFIWSAGVSAHWSLTDNARLDVSWAHDFNDLPGNEDTGFQRHGITIKLSSAF